MWDQIWGWAIDHHFFHAIVVLAVLYLIIFPGRFSGLFGKIKKIKAGPLELENIEPDIDPATPCPYTKSRDITFASLRDLKADVSGVKKELEEIMAIVKNMSIDQQKQQFYDDRQPDAERLAGGLKYLYQGGNGHTKKDVVEFAEKHRGIYNALTSVKPELRLVYEQK